MIFFLNTCSLGLNSCLKFEFNPFSITQNMHKILKHCTLEKITMTVLKQHLCSFLFVILNSNFFFNNARTENFNGYEFHFTGFIIFVLRDTQGLKSRYLFTPFFFIITFSLKRNAMIMHWSIIHLRGKLQYPLYGICRVRAVSRMLKIEPVVLNQEQLL